MLSEKEKLEEELKLLEESFNLEVITKDEYEDAKQRIDGKLNELKQNEDVKEESKPTEEKPETKKEESIVKYKDIREEEEKIEIKEIKEEEKIEEIKAAEEKKEEAEEVREEATEESVIEEKPEEEVEEEKPVTVVEEEKKSSKIFIYVGIILIIGFVSGYFFFSGDNDSETQDFSVDVPVETISFIACNSDDECIKEGIVGTCANSGTENSECEYIEDIKVELLVLNTNSCFNCDTGRVLSILNGFFPNIQTENVDFETVEGKEIADEYGIIALPAYILNSSLQETKDYYKFYNAFNKVGDSFVMKNTVSNANYYVDREEIPNKLDLFLKADQGASLKAEENLEEFWQAFDGVVVLEKHDSDSEIVEELGINTFPAFLINNKIKFSGVQAADKIRENFCQVNQLDECELELTKSLV